LSWNWISAWLENIAFDLQPLVVRVWSGPTLVGAGLFVSKDICRHRIIRARAMFLNEYPFDDRNMVIEYNGLLAARGHEEPVYREVLRHVFRNYKEFEEFHYGAIEYTECFQYLQKFRPNGMGCVIAETASAWNIDLESVAPGVSGVLSGLSRNRRVQIKRSIRFYESIGPINIDEARNSDEAMLFFKRLGELHTQRWERKGLQGVFANPLWVSFHHDLIRRGFGSGQIQLLKVYSDNCEIGYLYNFVWRGHVYVFQTGFVQSDDKRLMPGYVTHVYAVAHNREMGRSIYDLMHGEDLYKRILCNQNTRLVWAVMQRRRFKFSVERMATGVVRSLRKVISH